MIAALIALAVIALIILVIAFITREEEKCPYCGSNNLEIERVDATINFARWKAWCKECGKEFYIQ